MKSVMLVMFCCLCLNASSQEAKQQFDGKKWVAPYMLDTPKGWDIERFILPAAFAPSIPYKGVEDIRFAPGWSKKETAEYWLYDFLWYLEGKPNFNNKIIEKNLTAYYTGLANANIDKAKVDVNKLVTVKAAIKNKNGKKAATQAFEGTITILDFMTLQPISLNIRIYVTQCKGRNNTFVFHEVSPKDYNDAIWKSLDKLRTGFQCNKE